MMEVNPLPPLPVSPVIGSVRRVHRDGLALGIVKAIHGVDAEGHVYSEAQDDDQDSAHEDAHPDADRKETHAVKCVAKGGGVGGERLDLKQKIKGSSF